MEIWKPVERWGGIYEVSSEGRVRRGNRVLKPHVTGAGYRQATASLNGDRTIKQASVHRLVAEAFLGGIPDSMQINHKNGIRTDNRVENLEVVSCSDNLRHSFRVLGRKSPMGSAHTFAKLSEDGVREIRRLHADGTRQTEIAKLFCVDKTTVRDVVHRRTWNHV